MDNAADRKSIRSKEKLSKLADQNRREVLVGIMSTMPGREWVWNMLSRSHVFGMSFVSDAFLTAFREGERNQGQQLLNDVMEACPDQYVLAMRENNERRTQRDNTSRDSGRAAGQFDRGPNSGRYVEGLDASSDPTFGFEDIGDEAQH